MDEQQACAEFTDQVLSEVRRICSMGSPPPELLDKAARMADLVHNIPRWLVGQGPRDLSLFDKLEEFARYTSCEDLVADFFDRSGDTTRADRLRSAVRHV